MIPFLKSQGISYVSYLFLTHSDKDHTNGAVEWLCAANQMGVKIGTVILPKLNEKEEAYCTLLDELRNKGCNLMFMQRGDTVTIDELRISCLHPYPDYEWKSANDSSLVLKVNYQNFTGLFTGDLEEAGEKEIINKLSHVNYLKVAHHGSKGASSEIFLEQVKPDVSVISCGKKNRYGHPHKETLKRLENIGSKVYRTDKEGKITISGISGTMQLLKERILKDGVVKPGNILKVDSFLNHQMDIELFEKMGEEWKSRFAGKPINKVVTIEASGIGIACIVAKYFGTPVVFAKKSKSINIDGDMYVAEVESFTQLPDFDCK